MTTASRRVIAWSPRILGILVSLFLAVFALDAFNGQPILEALGDFVIHLIPAFVLLLVVAASWRRAWIGGVSFLALALLYATTMARGHVDWMLAIALPLAIVGALFLWSWRSGSGSGQLHSQSRPARH
jgi:hypothetical protein